MRYIQLLLIGVVLMAGPAGCRKPGSDGQASGRGYDPAEDPLVNPASLFEPLPEDPAAYNDDDTLYITLSANPNTMNPLFVSSAYDFIVVDALFASPFTFDADMEWQLNEEMVESFEESQDHTEAILKIKPGFKWHDGHPYTAHDIVYSWKTILDPQVPCQTQKPGTEPIKECVALDDYTVKYVQPEPLATRLWNILFPIIPKHVFEKHQGQYPDLNTGDYYTRLSREPVGSGPYRLVRWDENREIVMERWEDYAGEKPPFKRVVFRIIQDRNMAMLAFEDGRVDVVNQIPPDKFAAKVSENFRKIGYKAWAPQWTLEYIGWNMDGSNPFFADKRVRYAMTHAMNIPLILDKVYYNLHTPCHGEYHPDSWMFNPEIDLLEYDLEKSAALLDEAGWKVDPSDGWRYKTIDGRRAPFQFTMILSQGSVTSPKVAAIFQQNLQRIGVRMDTRVMEFASLLTAIRNHEFQSVMGAWGTGTDPDTGWNLWRTEQYETGRNYGGYSNPRVDELFELGRKEFDREKRKAIYQEISRILYDDQPYLWLNNRPELAAFNKRIHGVQFSPRGIYSFSPSFFGWWTAAAQ